MTLLESLVHLLNCKRVKTARAFSEYLAFWVTSSKTTSIKVVVVVVVC